MERQRVKILMKVVPVFAAVIMVVLTALPAQAASGNETAYAAVFDSTYYASHNPDLYTAFGNDSGLLLNHFLNHGMTEGRQGNEEFNVMSYKTKYADLQAAFGENLPDYYLHYITNGKAEGRIANETTTSETISDENVITVDFTDLFYNIIQNNSNPTEIYIDNNTTNSPQESTAGFEDEVVRLVNKVRAENGLDSLTTTSALRNAAQVRAGELETLFSHTRPDGSSCYTAFEESGAKYGYAGENIAAGMQTPEAVMQTWLNSAGHRANILSDNFHHIGVGCYQGNGRYGIYWTQCFTD